MMDVRGASRWLVIAASFASGCMVEVESPREGDDQRVESRREALGFQATPYDPEPPLTQIPSCWWVDNLADCEEVPECVPEAPSDGGTRTGPQTLTAPVAPVRTTTVTSTSTLRSTASTLSTTPTRTGSGTGSTSTALSIKQKDPCPSPNGVGTCSTCARSYLNPWQASLELGLASRVLITNGLNSSSYIVKNYPILNAQASSEEGTIPTINVDLTQGTTMMQSGSVNFTQDLYMFFTSDFETGPYPVGNWVFCPKNGNTCVQISE